MLIIYIKRLFKHLGIVTLLFAIPLAAFIFRGFAEKTDGALVGVYNTGSDREVTDLLLSSEGMLHFVEYKNTEEMQNDVAVQKLECAFILPENLRNLTGGDVKMICGTGYASVLSEVTKEAVFAAVLKVYGDEIALDFAKKNNFDIDEQAFRDNYKNYLSEIDSAVVFEEINIRGGEKTASANLIQCFAAIIMLCAGLIGCTFFVRDRKNGIYIDGSAVITAALVLFGASVTAACVLLKQPPDILRLAVFCIGVWGVCSIIAHIFEDERIIWLLMPVCIGLAVVFDIVDIAGIMPQLRIINYFLPTHFYVYGSLPQLMLFSGICCFCGVAANKIF